ncbi:DUF4388 domain-containing protein [Fontisphaera persica]|uniref:DUF4388 domain-containing protein n=1 Tax=Fontisphaera persica TaxID=2974023 RepID=UPI0024C00971|nr:DUF4388 domain-containing protein [Fontisphaera persica]WCJ59989.1 DUF4388 domain-containing protein [Fontisphaera persica]
MALAIHVLTGKAKGQEYLLPEDGDFIITSGGGEELCFNEGAGKPLAVLKAIKDQVTLQDAGAPEGVFVNRKKCAESPLKEGDAVRIGKTRFMLVKVIKYSPVAKAARARAADKGEKVAAPAKPAPAPRTSTKAPAPPPPAVTSLPPRRDTTALKRPLYELPESGTLQEHSLGELLRFFCAAGQSGVLSLMIEGDIGAVQINEGQIADAFIASSPAPSAKRALYRLFRWKHGDYVWQPGEAHPIEPSLQGQSLQTMLAEAEAESEAIEGLLAALPPPETKLAVGNLPRGALAKLSPPEMFIVGLVRLHGTVRAIIDHHPENDLVVCRLLVGLLRRNILCIPTTP